MARYRAAACLELRQSLGRWLSGQHKGSWARAQVERHGCLAGGSGVFPSGGFSSLTSRLAVCLQGVDEEEC